MGWCYYFRKQLRSNIKTVAPIRIFWKLGFMLYRGRKRQQIIWYSIFWNLIKTANVVKQYANVYDHVGGFLFFALYAARIVHIYQTCIWYDMQGRFSQAFFTR